MNRNHDLSGRNYGFDRDILHTLAMGFKHSSPRSNANRTLLFSLALDRQLCVSSSSVR
jgi:hypothetical protein